MKTNKLLIIDLEATCWEDKDPEYVRKNQEIIEIGLTLFNVKKKEIIENETFFVKPSTKLSQFCKNLTKIEDSMVENSLKLEEVLTQVDKKYNLKNICWGSWGFYDLNQLRRETKRKNINNPFIEKNYINLKTMTSLMKGMSKGRGIESVLSLLDLKFEGTPHRAVDDSKNIANILKTIL